MSQIKPWPVGTRVVHVHWGKTESNVQLYGRKGIVEDEIRKGDLMTIGGQTQRILEPANVVAFDDGPSPCLVPAYTIRPIEDGEDDGITEKAQESDALLV